jgi:hypothetical protein
MRAPATAKAATSHAVFFRLMVCAPLIEDGRDSRLRGNDENEATSINTSCWPRRNRPDQLATVKLFPGVRDPPTIPPAEMIPNSSPPRSPRFQANLELKF